jgi:hypothetical protein
VIDEPENKVSLSDQLNQLWKDLFMGIPDELRPEDKKFAVLQERFERIVQDVDWLEFRMDELEY